MNYNTMTLQLTDPLSFWRHFDGRERVFWYDTQKQRLIIGADRRAVLQTEADSKAYPYIFYGRTFFDTARGELWRDMGNEMIAFSHYYIADADGERYMYADVPETIDDDRTILRTHHYEERTDDYEAWQRLFTAITSAIQDGCITKAVASREVHLVGDEDFDECSILHRLVSNNPGCFIFGYHKEGRTFLGASPEILVQKEGSCITSYALAGTIGKTAENREAQGQRLLHDDKNVREHGIVVRMITESMKRLASSVTAGPMELMELKNLFHLRTLVTAEDNEHSLLDWSGVLHPTPAMGGQPRDVSLKLLKEYEGHERGLYASPLGMWDSKGDGVLAVGIRSALVKGKHMYAYAGCGIVDGSKCDEEYTETKTKLRTIVEAL